MWEKFLSNFSTSQTNLYLRLAARHITQSIEIFAFDNVLQLEKIKAQNCDKNGREKKLNWSASGDFFHHISWFYWDLSGSSWVINCFREMDLKLDGFKGRAIKKFFNKMSNKKLLKAIKKIYWRFSGKIWQRNCYKTFKNCKKITWILASK